MHISGGLRSEEATDAAWEGCRGAVVGAAKWGLFATLLGGVGYKISPIYRGLTIQFKVVRVYESKIRMHKRMLRDKAVWESYEKEFDDDDETPGQKPR
ncbi:imidazoleglycerol-phosphate dehydratase [Diplocarpon rosae]|nr:imidazoleglycerol-phosphate dehydratase [Diplocarpon rosae]